ncbi:MAG: TatD family hydrolase [Candidatus Bathyarchaeota archaeon]|nr:TatD family hydrolase [Candidatus Bathyarchaeota archaeon]MDH5495083.1 TatD family hydrolase [Candidatus Bathyarchaeota archaeon]
MRFVDAHVHLSDSEYEAYIDEIIKDAKRSNVVALVSNSMNLQTSLQSIKLAEKHPKVVYAALGIHPWNIKGLLPNELEHTTNLILNHKQHERVVAIGEIGLDYKYLKEGKQELLNMQYEVFCKMLQLSEKLSLPAIIHSRGTTSKIMDILSSYNIKKVLLHWFSNPMKLLPEIVERGYYITEGPLTVYSSHIRDIVRRIPLTHLLTETDGPVRYFEPPFKGEMTSPTFIPQVAGAIAEIKSKEKSEVAEQIFKNFESFFEIEQT